MYCDYRRIEGYENYIVSNYGKVYSLKRKIPIELKTTLDSKGYEQVSLQQHTIKIHVLVGNAFIGTRLDGMSYDHVDRNKLNNRADNIRLATRSEQIINQNVRRNNKLQERNIFNTVDKRNGNEYFHIQITRNHKNVFNKCLNKKKFTLADAVKVRDEFLRL